MRISFHGAAREVSGSCHLLEVKGKKILIDCGSFFGGRVNEAENKKPFGFNPEEIDYLVLSHAHGDHCGRVPLLVKQGFEGEILTTSASKDLSEIMLIDSAHIQQRDAEREARKNPKYAPKPLYTTSDVYNALGLFNGTLNYDEEIEIDEGIKLKLFDAGHILGSASISFEIKEGRKKRNVIFSGDIGNNDKPIVCNPTPPPQSDIVVMESTYGNRSHKPFEESVREFYSAINEAFNSGGNAVIPVFAIERTQEILYLIKEGLESGELPHDLEVYLDSPMAIKATKVFINHPEYFDKETRKLFKPNNNPFTFPTLTFTQTTEESKAINDIKTGAIILAGSGMANAGRVVHHLKRNLPRKECSVIIVSFASQGTLARRLVDGNKSVYIHGQYVPVKAKIHTIGGFSAHAGQDELLEWHESTKKPKNTFLTHGQEDAMGTLGEKLRAKGLKVEMPEKHSLYDL